MSGPKTIPQHAHPLVRALLEAMRAKGVGYDELASRAGVNRVTLRRWRNCGTPNVANLDACFGVLGLRLTVAAVESQAARSV